MSQKNKKNKIASDEIIKSSNLLQYLKEVVQLKNKSVRSIDNYENKVWLSDIPESKYSFIQPMIKGFPSNSDDELSDKWIEIKKPKLTNAPKLPRALEEWVDTIDINNPNILLSLKESIEVISNDENNEDVLEIKKLSENNYLKKIFKEYISIKWRPWSEIEKINHKVQEIYSEFYTIYSNQKKLSETYEILMGVGYLTWKTPSNYEVKRHGVTCNITIEFDAKRGVITIMPSGVNGFTYFEQDMLDYNEQLHGKEEEKIKKSIKELRYNVWGSKFVHTALNSWLNNLSPEGKYFNNILKHKDIKPDPIISFAPAIILRKRGQRNFIDFIEKANENILETEKLPNLVKSFVLPTNNNVSDNNCENKNENENHICSMHEDPYFPLPANDAQKKILTELNKKNAILVEGPPGTGKSHTIANIGTHLLSKGLKVLITSHGVRALKVLKNKFPKEIQSLCINVLGDDSKANQTLKDSIADINDRESSWDKNKQGVIIDQLGMTLKHCKKKEISIINDLVDIREQETKKHDKKFENYSGTLPNIAKVIINQKDKYNWISHKKESYDPCPITIEEIGKIQKLINLYTLEQKEDLKKSLIDLSDVWAPEKIEALCSAKKQIEQNLANIEKKKKIIVVSNSLKNKQQVEELTKKEDHLITILTELENKNCDWVNIIIKDIFNKNTSVWKSLLDQSEKNIQEVKNLNNKTKDLNIIGLDNCIDKNKLLSDIQSLIFHIKSGKGFGFSLFKSKIIKDTEYLWSNIKINGSPVKDKNSLEKLFDFVKSTLILSKLKVDWSISKTIFQDDKTLQLSQLDDLMKNLQLTLDFENLLINFKFDIQNIEKKELKINEENQLTIIDSKEHIIQYSYALHHFILKSDKKIIEEQLNQYRDLINGYLNSNDVSNIIQELLLSIEEESIDTYKIKYFELIKLSKQKKDIDLLNKLLINLKIAIPQQFDEYINSFEQSCWDIRFKDFLNAWYWSQANAWIQRLTDPKQYEILEKEHTDLIDEKLDLIKVLASHKSWSHFFDGPNGMQPQHLESLKAWTQLITSIGRGTGKHVARKRKDAKEKMQEMQDCIPCWVMPLYRVVENFKPGKHLFDVVIIDEASQSGPEAMILFFLAKKIIIVGDSKQIAPENISTQENNLVEIGNKYLKYLPHHELFANRENSFFDIGAVRIKGRIRLREHFRCVDEIIEYCNKRFYKGESLIPLRQFGSDRLSPIKTVYVREGYKEGEGQNTQNEPEADQIVNAINDCINNDIYKNKTIGVISLQGINQAKLIEQKLLSRIGAEKYEEYDIRCGDASSFQGDERNIIFLSMVIGMNKPFATLTRTTYQRRFNVAVSRAQDQLWLFHSVELNELNANCERAQLLSYCLNPDLDKKEHVNIEIPLDKIVRPFDSLFEQRVYMKIIERGYNVIPQFETYGRKIDLVIQGKKEKLAVECDGDHWHGAEQHEDDISRQRDLERCGWVFWRIRESSFYIDQDKSLKNLWIMLEERGIYPVNNIQNVEDIVLDEQVA